MKALLKILYLNYWIVNERFYQILYFYLKDAI